MPRPLALVAFGIVVGGVHGADGLARGVAALLALLAGLMGWWLIGVLFMAGTMLLLAILLRLALS